MIRLKKYALLALLFAMVFVSACGVQSKSVAQVQETVHTHASPARLTATEEAIVYVYRPASMSNVLVSPALKVNGKPVFEIKNDSYSYLRLAQGSHLFELDLTERYSGIKQLELDVASAHTYYLRISSQLSFQKNKPYIRRFDISLVSAETAQQEIDLKEIEHGEIEQGETNQTLPLEKKRSNAETATVKSDADLPADDEFSISKSRNPFSR